MGYREKPATRLFHQQLVWFVTISCSLVLSLSALHAAEFFNDWAAAHLGSVPSQSGPNDDPDGDGAPNLAEFAFGTDPLVGGGSAIIPRFGGTNGVFGVELFEQAGHRPGVQIDLDATVDMEHWIQPWWQRTTTNSLPGDPTNSVRELFTTRLPGTDTFIVRGVIQLIEAGAETANYYVATNGSDSASGTNIAQPFLTLGKAAGLAGAGKLVYMRGGKYAVASKISLTKIGTATQPIRIRAYPGETPILNGSSFSDDVLYITGSYYQLYGLVITNAGHNSIRILGNNNTIERCVSYGARNTGIHISGGQGDGIYPSNNLILNCDVIRSYDAPVGGNADGFSAKWDLGTNNVFRGCRSWENSDDGWDLWMGNAPVLIENCWTFRNGSNVWGAATNVFAGNGNGFKLGGSSVAAAHRLVGCLSFNNVGNGGHGIDQNNNTAGLTIDQNTSWANIKRNFNLNHSPNLNEAHIVRNNLSIAGGSSDAFTGNSTLISNSWQVITSPAAGTNDLLNVDTTFAIAPRRDDGGLPETPFMRPVPGGRLMDKGANLGEPFYGSAPDLGCSETAVW
jgi:hypothetical protein